MLEKFHDDREKMERYSAVAEFCPIPAFIVAHDGTSVVYTNKAYQRLLGKRLEDLQNYGWLTAVHPDDRPRARQEWETIIKTDVPLKSRRRYISPDGKPVECILTAQRVEQNGYVGFLVPVDVAQVVPPAGISPAA